MYGIYGEKEEEAYPFDCEIAGERRLRTKIYDKRDDFDFPIVNFPLICSNIPAAPAYIIIDAL
jgi:hypothetical protein